MNVTTSCPACKSSFNLDSQYVGSNVTCPKCQQPFVVAPAISAAGESKPAMPLPDPGLAAALGFIFPALGAFYLRAVAVGAVIGFVECAVVIFGAITSGPTDKYPLVTMAIRFFVLSAHVGAAIACYGNARSNFKR